MKSTTHSVIGIDITRNEVRVAEITGNGTKPLVVHAGVSPLPPGAVIQAQIFQADVVGDILRQLLVQLNISTRQAVFGISPRSVTTRTLDLPLVTGNAMRTIISGELAFQKLVPDDAASFDYTHLALPPNAANGAPQVLVMAAENRTVSLYAAIAERAGLLMIAAEPVLVALFRAAMAQVPANSPALCISISDGRIEAAIVDEGELRLYRRVDIGSDDLILDGLPDAGESLAPDDPFSIPADDHPASSSVQTQRTSPQHTAPLNPAPPRGGIPIAPAANMSEKPSALRHINPTAMQMLVLELGRSLDYYYREFPQAKTINQAVMATNDPALEPLAEWLSQALVMDVALAIPAATVSAAAASPLRVSEGLRFVGATGLAMGEITRPSSATPRFDLGGRHRAESEMSTGRRKMTFALAASIAIILIGIAPAFWLGIRANGVDHELFHAKEDLAGLQQSQQQLLSDFEAQQSQLGVLKRQGVPFARLMDAVAAGVAPSAGLTEVSLDTNGQMHVAGEAASEQAMIATLEGMKMSPYFVNPSLDSFDSTTALGQAHIVRFQISSQWAGAPPPVAAAAAP